MGTVYSVMTLLPRHPQQVLVFKLDNGTIAAALVGQGPGWVFEGGTATAGSSGNEMLKGDSSVNYNGNMDAGTLTAGQEYLVAHAHLNYGGNGGSSWNLLYRVEAKKP